MKRKTCMCGCSTDKVSRWDFDLDQCKKCTKKQKKEAQRIEDIYDYLNSFVVGDLVCWRNKMHLLIEKIEENGMWRLLDPTTGNTHKFFANNWVLYADCPNIREIIYKWTDSDRS